MHAWHEHAVAAEHVENCAAHARHDPHVDDDIRAVRQLDADVRDRAAQRAHRKRHHIERPAAHAAREEAIQRAPHVRGRDPVVGRAGVVLAGAADESAVFHPRYIGGIRAGQVAAWPLDRIEARQRAGGDHLGAQAVVFGLAAVAPHDALRLRQGRDFANPAHEAGMLHIGRRTHGCGKCDQRFELIHLRGRTVAGGLRSAVIHTSIARRSISLLRRTRSTHWSGGLTGSASRRR